MSPKKISTKLTLDNALRYLYICLVYLEVPLVAIRFQFNDETWEADTIEEAVALRAKLEYSTRFLPDPLKEMDKAERFWSPDKFMDAIGAMGEHQRRLLKAICQKPGIASVDLRKQLKLESEVALAGVISGLSKQLKQVGIELKQVLGINVTWSGKKKTRTFHLDDFFWSTGTELGWPDSWSDKGGPIRRVADATARKENKDAQETRAMAPTSAGHQRKQ